MKLSSGALFFGGINGFNLFLPGNIVYNTQIPQVHLSSIKVFDKTIIIPPGDSGVEISLNYNQNYLSFEMAALNFDHPEKNQFAYQLEGFDKEMIYAGQNHVASYTNIPPGNYSLHILAANNDGLWNREGARIRITIVPPFWNSAWFRIIAISVLCLLVYLFFYFRVRKIKREEKLRSEINRQVAEARLTALGAQMNPHFIFNSLNSIQHFISESEKENALKYLSKFSKLIRLVLQNADKNTTTITNEISMLEFYLELEALRFSNKFSYHIVIDPGINKDATEVHQDGPHECRAHRLPNVGRREQPGRRERGDHQEECEAAAVAGFARASVAKLLDREIERRPAGVSGKTHGVSFNEWAEKSGADAGESGRRDGRTGTEN